MLVLTRRVGELILIGDEIQLKVIDVEAGRGRIGITAPRHVPLTRSPAASKPPIQSPRWP